MTKYSDISEAYENMLDTLNEAGESDPVVKITAKAIADCKKIVFAAAKKAAKASGKPEGRLSEWIQGKLKFDMKQWR